MDEGLGVVGGWVCVVGVVVGGGVEPGVGVVAVVVLMVRRRRRRTVDEIRDLRGEGENGVLSVVLGLEQGLEGAGQRRFQGF